VTASAAAPALGAPRPGAAAAGRPLVLMLSAAHPPDDLRVVRKEGAAIAAAGWRVRHLAPGFAPPPVVDGVAIETFEKPRGWLGRLLGIPRLARRAAASGAAVIHASEPDSWLAALLAARRCGARTVLDVHEHYPSRLDARLPRFLRPVAREAIRFACRAMARHADAVVVAKDGLDQDFSAPAKIVAVRNYAPAARVAPHVHAAGPLTLVHLGALSAARGAFTMLEALALLPPATRLLLIGRFTDGSEEAFLASAEALGLRERVLQAGWMPHEAALARAAGQGDVGLVLFQPGVENHRLALPHKLFDCMAAGLPVIVPAFAEEVAAVVREAGCGVVADVAEPRAVAEAIRSLADPLQRARLGAAGVAAARGRFAWGGEAERLVALYGRLAPLPSRQNPPPL
jgi:glycosyltransferase involved in cell wall biosynthesis